VRFSLKSPCAECPFNKSQSYLNEARAREIAEAVAVENRTFTCHKHLHGEYADDDEAQEEGYSPTVRDQMCAGAMAFVEKLGVPNQMLQIAERLGLRDPSRLDPASLDEVYDSIDDMAAGHALDRRS
jgi:hypothetical protein